MVGATGYGLASPPQDANGFTIWPAAENTYYVSSSSGNDANNGLSPATPKATIAAGWWLLRSGHGDHHCLKCGDTFHEAFPHWAYNGGGASRTNPMIIGSYGIGPRPIIEATAAQTANTGSVFDFSGGGGAPNTGFAHIWIFDLDFYCNYRDPNAAAYDSVNGPLTSVGAVGVGMPFTDMLLENCRFRFFSGNIGIQSTGLNDIRLRRCQVNDAWYDVSAHSQGMFANGVNNFLIEDNVFDHDGWNATGAGGVATVFNHGIYINACQNVTVRATNTFSNASNMGIHLTAYVPGTSTNVLIYSNLFVADPNGIAMGAGWAFGATNITVSSNVFTEIGGTSGGVAQSVGMYVDQLSTVAVTNNYFVNKQAIGQPNEFIVNPDAMNNLQFTGNTIFKWGGEDGTGSGIANNGTPETSVTLGPNNINLGAAAYMDATRTMGTYDTSIGGPGTSADFIQQARNQSKATWNPAISANAVVAYFSWGYQLVLGD